MNHTTSGSGVFFVPLRRVTSSASVRAEAGGGASATVIGFGFGLQPDREPPPRSAPTPLRLHLAGHVTDAARAYPAREHPFRWLLGGDASSLRRLAASLPPLQRLQEVPRLQEETWQQKHETEKTRKTQHVSEFIKARRHRAEISTFV